MTKTLVACTYEADNQQVAVEQIVSGLKLEGNLLKHSIGIISCHYEFVLSGVVQAICDALPFDVVGSVSSAISACNNSDMLLMSIMVITSDDIEFVKILTEPIAEAADTAIANSYKKSAKQGQKPALILAYAPFIPQNVGDEYIDVISEVSGGAPCFGSLAADGTLYFSDSYTIFNGKHYTDRMVMVLAYGSISPKFYVAHISPDKVLPKTATITKSDRHIIMELDKRPVISYFEDLNLTNVGSTMFDMALLPFMLDYKDGTPSVAKTFVLMTPDGYALCAGAVPEGCSLNVAMTDADDIIVTTNKFADDIFADIENASGLLIYSCIARSMALGNEQFREMNLIEKKLSGRLNYMMAYCGGEMCPTAESEGSHSNRFHNNTIIACLF